MSIDNLLKNAAVEARILIDDIVECLPEMAGIRKPYGKHDITGTTQAFRNSDLFVYLSNIALPEVYKTRGSSPITIWSTACSTGDEAFSLAMIALRFMEKHPDAIIRIVATDINPERIKQAQSGIFNYFKGLRGKTISGTDTILFKDSHLNLVSQYSVASNPFYESTENCMERIASPEVLDLCDFKAADMTTMGIQADIIVASNAIMYLSFSDRRKARKHLTDVLSPGGYLFMEDMTRPLFNLHPEVKDGSFIGYRKPAMNLQAS